jgi:hypothetical protein
MGIFALQSPAGGFLDEELHRFNKEFDDWCAQFETLEDATRVAQSLEHKRSVDVIEITPLSYPKYFFYKLQGEIHATREVNGKIVCIVEPAMGANYRLAICDMETKHVRLTKTRYKTVLSVEGAFTHYEE